MKPKCTSYVLLSGFLLSLMKPNNAVVIMMVKAVSNPLAVGDRLNRPKISPAFPTKNENITSTSVRASRAAKDPSRMNHSMALSNFFIQC